MFHLSGKMFRFKELVNPFIDLRNTGIVLSSVIHTIIMVNVVNVSRLGIIWQGNFQFSRDSFAFRSTRDSFPASS